MKKQIITLIVMTLCFWISSASAQRFSAIFEKLDQLEEQIKQLGATQKREIQSLRNQLAEQQSGEETTSVEQAISLLGLELERLAEEVESIKAGANRNGGMANANSLGMNTDEATELLYELMGKYKNTEQGDAVEPVSVADSETNQISGVGDLFVATVQEQLSGVTFEAVYTSELSSNLFGGLRNKTVFLDNVDLSVTLDAQEVFGWPGATFFLYGLGNNGGSPSENVGDVQTVSNIDAPDTWKVYELWMQQNFFADKLSLLAGLYDLNSEFDVIETGGLFFNSSHGIGPDFSQTGLNGPSIFPNTSLGLRVKVQPADAFYVQTVVLDGVSGDPDNLEGTKIRFGHDDGVLFCTEIAYLTGTGEDSRQPYGKIALGVHYYTTRFESILEEDIAGNPKQIKSSPGFYLLTERTVFQEKNDLAQGLALFGRIGFADSKVNQFSLYTGGGMVYTGLFPGRDEDQLGLAIAAAHNGDRFKQAQFNAGTPVDDSEVTLELTYHAGLTSWLAVQPDLQYVVNPGTDPAVANAFVMNTRFEITF